MSNQSQHMLPRQNPENGFTEEDMKKGNSAKIFGLTFLFSMVMAFNLALFLNDADTRWSWGAMVGFPTGFGWVAMSIFTIGQFERKPSKYMLIHAYMVAMLPLVLL